MTIAALALAAVALISVIAIAVHLRAMRRHARRRNGDGSDFVAWDWPQRPVNGHDHPEPPELLQEGEPAA